jgi:DNA-binding Lrp family transcriptional regulator
MTNRAAAAESEPAPDGSRLQVVDRTRDSGPPVELDAADRNIVGLLLDDPRISARAIGRHIGMSPGAVTERIARLHQRGVIAGYQLAVNPSALGYNVHALVGLQTDQGSTFDQAVESLRKIPEIISLHIVTGRWDVLVEVRVRDHEHLLDVMTNRILTIPGFRHSETMLSLRAYTDPRGWRPPELQEAAGGRG